MQIDHQAHFALLILMFALKSTEGVESKPSARRLQTCARRTSAHQKSRPDLADSFKNDVTYVETYHEREKSAKVFKEALSRNRPSFNWACQPKKSACAL